MTSSRRPNRSAEVVRTPASARRQPVCIVHGATSATGDARNRLASGIPCGRRTRVTVVAPRVDVMPESLSPQRSAIAVAVIAAIAGRGAVLREDQSLAVAALCEPAARVLVVQATGWGKSAVYWAATAIRRREGCGPALVVSPLLSLMRDQLVAAGRAGLRAATLNSSNVDAWSQVEAALRADELDVLLVSPERLANPGFGRRVLLSLIHISEPTRLGM